MTDDPAIHAYDLAMASTPMRADAPPGDGWTYGLPPGIAPARWPLDPVTGYPLAHGFTLSLPEDHRVHGPEIVAVSFFVTPFDHNDGGADGDADVARAVLGEGDRPGGGLGALWDHAQGARPRLHRMTDILGYAYAAILLTPEEFAGAPCAPPDLAGAHLDPARRPAWLDRGAAAAFYGDPGASSLPEEQHYLYRVFGGRPPEGIAVRYAITARAREGDPNAGLRPADVYGDRRGPDGYQSPFADEGYQPWAKDRPLNHVGGTMLCQQGVPDFSPHYVEFEEYFCGTNFGTGNAQLDLESLRFDWACG